MGRELTITMHGKDTRVGVRSLIEMLEYTLGVLRELDASLADDEQASVQWEVVKVSMNSALTVTLGPRVPEKRRDTSAEIVKSFVLGSRSLEHRAAIPSNWTDEALVRMRKLADLRSNGIASMVFRTQGEDAVEPTLHTVANIEEIQSKTTAHDWEHTSIEGRLEVISAHNGTRISIWDLLTNTKVECLVDDAQLEQAKGAFRRRVVVTGRAKMSRKGRPTQIEVDSIRVLREKDELPQATDFSGSGRVDITGGVDAADFIRSLRDAQ